MNGTLLEGIARATDLVSSVPALRRLVVALAVSGKLDVPRGEVANSHWRDLLSTERRRLVQSGKLKSALPLLPPTPEDLPPALTNPNGFERLGNLAVLEKGRTGIQSASRGTFPLVVTAEERASCDHYDFEGSAAIIPMVSSAGHGKASIKRLHYQEGRFALGNILCACFPISDEVMSARFLYEYLSAFKDELLVTRMSGTANVSLTVGKIAEVPVPVPSLAVQRKADELMTLCDELEAAQKEREERRNHLAAASLVRLNQPADDVAKFREHARFHLRHLPRLVTKPEHVKQLRQTVLNLAVRGKLVPQDPSDEPPETALRACDEIRRKTALSDRRADAKPQDLIHEDGRWPVPASWAWRGVADLVLFIDYRGKTPAKTDEGIPLVTAKNVRRGFISQTPEEFIADSSYAAWMTRGLPQYGDVLFTTEAPMGNAAVVHLRERFALAQRVICFRGYGALVPEFLSLQLLSPPFQAVLDEASTGLTAKGIKAAKLKRLPIVVPPTQEQHRIVAKVDELMAICDQLGAQLAANDAGSQRLLEAVLHEALAEAS